MTAKIVREETKRIDRRTVAAAPRRVYFEASLAERAIKVKLLGVSGPQASVPGATDDAPPPTGQFPEHSCRRLTAPAPEKAIRAQGFTGSRRSEK